MLQATQQTTQPSSLGAFIGGINAADSLANMSPAEMVTCINMDISPEGLTVRDGFKEWCEEITDTGGVRTIIPYTASTIGSGDNRLFICASTGIYEATNPGVAPTKMVTWGGDTARAGYCSWHSYTALSGVQYILLCDLVNGYWVFDPNAGGGTWTQIAAGAGAGQINGADPADFDFVNVWKGRVWFVEKETGTAWYTAPGAYTGTVTPFYFGNKFRYGGHLKGVYNYTVDGGDGVDDYLVAVSEAGDVCLYQGLDPSSDFFSQGTFYVGAIPRGRRIATEHGGDLLITSLYGVIPISSLIAGIPSLSEAAITYKIEPLINARHATTHDEYGWELKFNPKNRQLILSSPKASNEIDVQYVYNITLKAWTLWSVRDSNTFENWISQSGEYLFMGRNDGKLFYQAGAIDNVLLDSQEAPTEQIDWYFLSSFNTYSNPAQFKRVQLMRPEFITVGTPAYNVEARYDYDLTPVASPSVGGDPGDVTSTWDTALWDTAFWGGRSGSLTSVSGAKGIGRSIAVGMRGLSSGETNLVAIDMMLDVGGML